MIVIKPPHSRCFCDDCHDARVATDIVNGSYSPEEWVKLPEDRRQKLIIAAASMAQKMRGESYGLDVPKSFTSFRPILVDKLNFSRD